MSLSFLGLVPMTALLLSASWLQADAAWCRTTGLLLPKQFQRLGAIRDSASRPLTFVNHKPQHQQDNDHMEQVPQRPPRFCTVLSCSLSASPVPDWLVLRVSLGESVSRVATACSQGSEGHHTEV